MLEVVDLGVELALLGQKRAERLRLPARIGGEDGFFKLLDRAGELLHLADFFPRRAARLLAERLLIEEDDPPVAGELHKSRLWSGGCGFAALFHF